MWPLFTVPTPKCLHIMITQHCIYPFHSGKYSIQLPNITTHISKYNIRMFTQENKVSMNIHLILIKSKTYYKYIHIVYSKSTFENSNNKLRETKDENICVNFKRLVINIKTKVTV